MNRLIRWLLVCILTTTFLPVVGGAAQEDRSEGDVPLDLAAIALRPSDAEAVGLDGFGVNRFGYPGNGVDLRRHAFFVGYGDAGLRQEHYLDAGLEREYIMILGLPDADGTSLVQQVEIHLTEFRDADGAEAGFAAMTDVALSDDSESSAEEIENADELAEESRLYAYEIVEDGEEYSILALTLRLDRVTARIAYFDFDGGEPDQEVLELLGDRQIERIEAGLEGELPGDSLSFQMPRFQHSDDGSTDLRNEGYTLLDGVLAPSAGEDESTASARAARYGDAIDVYMQFRRFEVKTESTDPNNAFSAQLLRFNSDRDAEAWMTGAIDEFEAGDGLEDLDVDTSAADYGDESVVYTYARAGNNADQRWNYRRIFLRVDSTVAVMFVQRLNEPLTPILDPLARAQVVCIENGACDNPLYLPPAAKYQETVCPDEPTHPSRAEDGEVLWCFETGGGAYATQAGDILLVWSGDGNLSAIEAESGALRWRVTPGPVAAATGYAPLVVGEVVIVTLPYLNSMFAFDIETGAERWRRAGVFDENPSPMGEPWFHEDVVSIIGGEELLRIDPETGDIVEQIDLELDGANVSSIDDGVIYAWDYVTGDDDSIVLAIDLDDGAEIWSTSFDGAPYSSFVAAGDALFVAVEDGVMTLDRGTGEITGEIPIDADLTAMTRLIAAEDTLYLHHRDQTAPALLAIDIESEEIIWTYEYVMNGYLPTVSGDTIYVPGIIDEYTDVAVAIDRETGRLRWEAQTGAYDASELIAGDGIVYAPTIGGTLIAFADSQAKRDWADASREENGDANAQGGDSGADGLETYESSLYGYAITYDPETWILVDDQRPDDDYDWVSFATAGGFVSIVGDPDYDEDELDSCVDDYRTILEETDGVSGVRELRNQGGEEDDRVWAVFTYDYDDGEESDVFVRSISCQALGDGVTLVVMYDAHEDDYDAFVDDAEQLLASLEAA
jgi:outer membrane protein assembly factor BamB